METMIRNMQQASRWNEDIQRRLRTRKYLDYYRNRCKEYIAERIDSMVDGEEAKELKKYIEHDNITERFVDEISLVFAEKVKITARRRKPDGSLVEDAEAQKEIERLLRQTRFQVTMKEVERLTKLIFDVAVLPQVRDGKVELDIITGDKAFVIQQIKNTVKAEQFYYQVGLRENTALAERVDIFHFWTADGRKYQCEIMANGQPDPQSVTHLNHIAYPNMPVVMFRNYLPIDTFWFDGENAIVEKNIAIDLKRTDLAMAEAYNIPQLFTTGTRENQDMKKGRTFKIDIPRNDMGEAVGDAKYLSPNEPLKELNEMINSRIEQLGLSKGLSKSLISGTTVSSGYALALSKYEIVERNRRQRDYYYDSVLELVENMIITANRGLGWEIPEDLVLGVDFGEIRFGVSDQEKEEIRQMKLQNGTISRIDIMLEDNPELDRDMAIEQATRIDSENLRFAQTAS